MKDTYKDAKSRPARRVRNAVDHSFDRLVADHGLNATRVADARSRGLTVTTLTHLLLSRPANEVNAMLIPLALGHETHDDLVRKASTLYARATGA